MKKVVIDGNYTVSNILIHNEGPFNITLTNMSATGTVDLATNDEGKLYANNSVIDIDYEKIEVSRDSTLFNEYLKFWDKFWCKKPRVKGWFDNP